MVQGKLQFKVHPADPATLLFRLHNRRALTVNKYVFIAPLFTTAKVNKKHPKCLSEKIDVRTHPYMGYYVGIKIILSLYLWEEVLTGIVKHKSNSQTHVKCDAIYKYFKTCMYMHMLGCGDGQKNQKDKCRKRGKEQERNPFALLVYIFQLYYNEHW